MAIPKYDEMYREFLEVLSDNKPHKISEIRDTLQLSSIFPMMNAMNYFRAESSPFSITE